MISDGEVLLAPSGHSELVSSAPDKASNSDSRIASSMVEQETLNRKRAIFNVLQVFA